MNVVDIVPPDFKLTGEVTLPNGSKINILRQRRPLLDKYYIQSNLDLTPYMQLNVPELEHTSFLNIINSVPNEEMELFVVGLGRKDYMDEILLCVYMNTTKDEFLNIIHLLYLRLRNIIDGVMTLTAGCSGSRRPIYQHYFYLNGAVPHKGDSILKSIPGIKLTTIYEIEFQSISQLRGELIALDKSEDVPIIDLIDITLDQFNTILKLLPKENAWLKSRKDRRKFFSVIIVDLDKLEDLSSKLNIMTRRYDDLKAKFNKNNILLDELQLLSELNSKDVINTIRRKILITIATINVFTAMYNASGTLRYKGKTLTQSSSIVNDLLNSQFMTFLQTFKSQHKNMLMNSIDSKIKNTSESQAPLPTSRLITPTDEPENTTMEVDTSEVAAYVPVVKLATKRPINSKIYESKRRPEQQERSVPPVTVRRTNTGVIPKSIVVTTEETTHL